MSVSSTSLDPKVPSIDPATSCYINILPAFVGASLLSDRGRHVAGHYEPIAYDEASEMVTTGAFLMGTARPTVINSSPATSEQSLVTSSKSMDSVLEVSPNTRSFMVAAKAGARRASAASTLGAVSPMGSDSDLLATHFLLATPGSSVVPLHDGHSAMALFFEDQVPGRTTHVDRSLPPDLTFPEASYQTESLPASRAPSPSRIPSPHSGGPSPSVSSHSVSSLPSKITLFQSVMLSATEAVPIDEFSAVNDAARDTLKQQPKQPMLLHRSRSASSLVQQSKLPRWTGKQPTIAADRGTSKLRLSTDTISSTDEIMDESCHIEAFLPVGSAEAGGSLSKTGGNGAGSGKACKPKAALVGSRLGSLIPCNSSSLEEKPSKMPAYKPGLVQNKAVAPECRTELGKAKAHEKNAVAPRPIAPEQFQSPATTIQLPAGNEKALAYLESGSKQGVSVEHHAVKIFNQRQGAGQSQLDFTLSDGRGLGARPLRYPLDQTGITNNNPEDPDALGGAGAISDAVLNYSNYSSVSQSDHQWLAGHEASLAGFLNPTPSHFVKADDESSLLLTKESMIEQPVQDDEISEAIFEWPTRSSIVAMPFAEDSLAVMKSNPHSMNLIGLSAEGYGKDGGAASTGSPEFTRKTVIPQMPTGNELVARLSPLAKGTDVSFTSRWDGNGQMVEGESGWTSRNKAIIVTGKTSEKQGMLQSNCRERLPDKRAATRLPVFSGKGTQPKLKSAQKPRCDPLGLSGLGCAPISSITADNPSLDVFTELQQSYSDLLTKYALAEVTIDQLRLGAKLKMDGNTKGDRTSESSSMKGTAHEHPKKQLQYQATNSTVRRLSPTVNAGFQIRMAFKAKVIDDEMEQLLKQLTDNKGLLTTIAGPRVKYLRLRSSLAELQKDFGTNQSVGANNSPSSPSNLKMATKLQQMTKKLGVIDKTLQKIVDSIPSTGMDEDDSSKNAPLLDAYNARLVTDKRTGSLAKSTVYPGASGQSQRMDYAHQLKPSTLKEKRQLQSTSGLSLASAGEGRLSQMRLTQSKSPKQTFVEQERDSAGSCNVGRGARRDSASRDKMRRDSLDCGSAGIDSMRRDSTTQGIARMDNAGAKQKDGNSCSTPKGLQGKFQPRAPSEQEDVGKLRSTALMNKRANASASEEEDDHSPSSQPASARQKQAPWWNDTESEGQGDTAEEVSFLLLPDGLPKNAPEPQATAMMKNDRGMAVPTPVSTSSLAADVEKSASPAKGARSSFRLQHDRTETALMPGVAIATNPDRAHRSTIDSLLLAGDIDGPCDSSREGQPQGSVSDTVVVGKSKSEGISGQQAGFADDKTQLLHSTYDQLQEVAKLLKGIVQVPPKEQAERKSAAQRSAAAGQSKREKLKGLLSEVAQLKSEITLMGSVKTEGSTNKNPSNSASSDAAWPKHDAPLLASDKDSFGATSAPSQNPLQNVPNLKFLRKKNASRHRLHLFTSAAPEEHSRARHLIAARSSRAAQQKETSRTGATAVSELYAQSYEHAASVLDASCEYSSSSDEPLQHMPYKQYYKNRPQSARTSAAQGYPVPTHYHRTRSLDRAGPVSRQGQFQQPRSWTGGYEQAEDYPSPRRPSRRSNTSHSLQNATEDVTVPDCLSARGSFRVSHEAAAAAAAAAVSDGRAAAAAGRSRREGIDWDEADGLRRQNSPAFTSSSLHRHLSERLPGTRRNHLNDRAAESGLNRREWSRVKASGAAPRTKWQQLPTSDGTGFRNPLDTDTVSDHRYGYETPIRSRRKVAFDTLHLSEERPVHRTYATDEYDQQLYTEVEGTDSGEGWLPQAFTGDPSTLDERTGSSACLQSNTDCTYSCQWTLAGGSQNQTQMPTSSYGHFTAACHHPSHHLHTWPPALSGNCCQCTGASRDQCYQRKDCDHPSYLRAPCNSSLPVTSHYYTDNGLPTQTAFYYQNEPANWPSHSRRRSPDDLLNYRGNCCRVFSSENSPGSTDCTSTHRPFANTNVLQAAASNVSGDPGTAWPPYWSPPDQPGIAQPPAESSRHEGMRPPVYTDGLACSLCHLPAYAVPSCATSSVHSPRPDTAQCGTANLAKPYQVRQPGDTSPVGQPWTSTAMAYAATPTHPILSYGGMAAPSSRPLVMQAERSDNSAARRDATTTERTSTLQSVACKQDESQAGHGEGYLAVPVTQKEQCGASSSYVMVLPLAAGQAAQYQQLSAASGADLQQRQEMPRDNAGLQQPASHRLISLPLAMLPTTTGSLDPSITHNGLETRQYPAHVDATRHYMEHVDGAGFERYGTRTQQRQKTPTRRWRSYDSIAQVNKKHSADFSSVLTDTRLAASKVLNLSCQLMASLEKEVFVTSP